MKFKESNVLEMISGNPSASIAKMAEYLKYPEEEVKKIMDDLKSKGFLPESAGMSRSAEDVFPLALRPGLKPVEHVLIARVRIFPDQTSLNDEVPTDIYNAAYAALGAAKSDDAFWEELKRSLGFSQKISLSAVDHFLIWDNPEVWSKEQLMNKKILSDIHRVTVIHEIHFETAQFSRSVKLSPRQQAYKVFHPIVDELEKLNLVVGTVTTGGVRGFSFTTEGLQTAENIKKWRESADVRLMKMRHVPQILRCKSCGERLLETTYHYDQNMRTLGCMVQLTSDARVNGWSLPFSHHENLIDCPSCGNSFLNDDGKIIESCLVHESKEVESLELELTESEVLAATTQEVSDDK